MKRTIKFRAWDKDNGKMLSLGEAYKKELIGIDFGDSYLRSEYPDDVLLMQYTGLHDKHGKEIFEGDIIRDSEDKAEKPEIISWGEGEWLADDLALNSYLFSKEGTASFVEIIGNIYEHPHLLNNQQ